MDWVLPLRTPFFNQFFEWVTLAGYPLFLILFLSFGYFAFGAKRFFHTAVLLMAAGLLNSLLKDLGQDARPDAAYALDGRVGDSYGWPSGHMQIAVVLWGYLAYTLRAPLAARMIWSNWAIWGAAVMMFLIGFSRLYLGVHDVGDVAAGFVFGVLCLLAYIVAQENARSRAFFTALSGFQAIALLIGVHLIYSLFYPAHIGHDAPYWFMGAMTGWLVGHYGRGQAELVLPGGPVLRAIIASAMTGLAFILLTLFSRLPRLMGEENALVAYGCGVLFGAAVIFGLPFLLAQIMRFTKASAS